MSRKLLTTLVLCMFIVGTALAQKGKIQRANAEFEAYNYEVAIQLYLEVMQKTELAEAKINLAECYRKVGNTAEAEYWFGQVVHLPEAEDKHFLYYGMALQANNKCDLAKEWFAEYAKRNPNDLRGQFLSQTCDKDEIQKMILKSKDFYEINRLPINTMYDDLSPVFFGDGLIFASERDNRGPVSRIHEWTGFPFLELYSTSVDTLDAENFEYTYEKEPSKVNLNTKFHDGPIMFSQDQKTVFITRNNLIKNKTGRDEEGVTRLKILTADADGKNWSNFKELIFNSDEFSVAHPALSADGQTLYFSSDMPGGFGGMDLYYATLEDGEWVNPINLGSRVNTEGHEVFPYVHPATDRLYFSSDGHIGLGKLDLFYIEKIDGTWGPVMNIGAPINSTSDDFGMILNEDGDFGYFTSNREDGVGRDDIYSFKRSVVKVEIEVYDQNNNQPIAGATVFNDCSQETLITAKNGRVTIEMPVNKCCTFTANKETYLENKKESCTEGYEPGTSVVARIPLSRPLDFALEGVITDSESGNPINMASVILTNDCDKDTREFQTGPDGRYSFTDLDQNCCYFVTAKKDFYLSPPDPNRVCTRGKSESETFVVDIELSPAVVAVNNDPNNPDKTNNSEFPNGGGNVDDPNNPNNPDNRETIDIAPIDPDVLRNRVGSGTVILEGRSYILEHIYYDFDKYYLRDDEETNRSLTQLLSLLQANPDYIVEIGSHTDARGTDRYNQWLSRKRAKAVVAYLVENGISQSQLTYSGYGENEPTNDCFNEVPCTEEQHQRNRRTEFTIIGFGETRFEKGRSVPLAIVRTDPCVDCPF